jgi:hypothetical protein
VTVVLTGEGSDEILPYGNIRVAWNWRAGAMYGNAAAGFRTRIAEPRAAMPPMLRYAGRRSGRGPVPESMVFDNLPRSGWPTSER